MRRYLLGYDTADGLKRSAKAREYMQDRDQDDLTPLYAMPDLSGLYQGAYKSSDEKIRLYYLQKSIDDARNVPVQPVEEFQFVEFPTQLEPSSPECYLPPSEMTTLKETPTLWQRFLKFLGF